MSGILDLLNSDLGESIISGVAGSTGNDSDKTSSVLTMALPVLMKAMERNAATPEGAEGLMGALSGKHDGSILDNLGGLFSGGVDETIKQDGILGEFEEVGATVLANACGPCIGQWKREDKKKGEANSILTSYNRNFAKRNDGNPETLGFISSPELVVAMAFSGSMKFNPLTDSLKDENGNDFK